MQPNRNIKLTLTYDGTHYLGWQKTKEGASIEETLQHVLEQILQHAVVLQAASRTDAGVHASGQVVNFFTSNTLKLDRMQIALNSLLPKEISVTQIDLMPDTFHPTIDCIGKEYRYYICNSKFQSPFQRFFSWHYPANLHVELMREAAQLLIGEHDFAAFCNFRKQLDYTDTIRRVDLIEVIQLKHNRLCIRIVGNHFLYKMVRNIVGTLVYIGTGKLHIDQLPRILSSHDRTLAGMTAPAEGLFLHEILYPI